MTPKITQRHSETDINVLGIVQRIIRHLPSNIYEGLQEIVILDSNPNNTNAFACYRRADRRIELYLDGITLWQPWLLKKTYLFPYLFIGMALGHELDHHVNRNGPGIDRETSAETNALRYVYPSLGLFKPIFRLISIIARARVNKRVHRIADKPGSR